MNPQAETVLPDRRMRLGDEAARGVLAMLPVLAGLTPFAAVVGATVAAHDDPVAAWAGTFLIYGGSAQLAVLTTLSGGAGLALAVVTGLLVNARLLVYGATMARHWRGEDRRFRALAAALLIDPSWALGMNRYGDPGTARQRRHYYLGAALSLWLGWGIIVTAVAIAGPQLGLDTAMPLSLAAPLCLLVLIAPTLRERGGRAAAGAAAVATVAVAVQGASPANLLVAMAAGVAAGLLADRGGRR